MFPLSDRYVLAVRHARLRCQTSTCLFQASRCSLSSSDEDDAEEKDEGSCRWKRFAIRQAHAHCQTCAYSLSDKRKLSLKHVLTVIV